MILTGKKPFLFQICMCLHNDTVIKINAKVLSKLSIQNRI